MPPVQWGYGSGAHIWLTLLPEGEDEEDEALPSIMRQLDPQLEPNRISGSDSIRKS